MSKRIKIAGIIALNCLVSVVDGEENEISDNDDDLVEDILQQGTKYGREVNLAMIALVLGIICTIMSSILAFVTVMSFKEDALMNLYRNRAEVVRGEVTHLKIVRGNDYSQNAVYSICVDYDRELTKYYAVRVRKLLKIKGESLRKDHPVNFMNFILLYVLPEKHKSGFPKDVVDKRCEFGYRFSTAMMLSLAAALAITLFLLPLMHFLKFIDEDVDDNEDVKKLV